MTPTRAERFDLVIVGGGMVGAALACALGREGFNLALIEGREPQQDWPVDEIDLRVSALTRASENLLRRLDAWPAMQRMGVSPYRRMRVWDAGSSGQIHFDCADIGEENLGHIVENRVTQLALWRQLEGLASVRRFCPARVVGLDLDLDLEQGRLQLADGRVLQAGLMVGADGRDSPIRQMAGMAVRGWDYDQHALVATVRPAGDHQHTAWQRFMASGPLAFLPLNEGRCSIVWSTRQEQAQQLLRLDESAFLQQLTQASEGRLGQMLAVGPRAVFPLRLQHALAYVRPGLALIGDAAHAIHPLAGQGVNLGLLDVAALSQALLEGRSAGRKPGQLRDLRRYERLRKGDNLSMQLAMDGFKRAFSNTHPVLGLARGLGLRLADEIGPLNQGLMRHALGLAGELPPLSRPLF
jgi:2-octaprenylphenol hydroxylase